MIRQLWRWLQNNSFRTKIYGLITMSGLLMLLLLALYSPWQARQVGQANLRENAGFITNLLRDNLALGIQTIIFDDGATIQDAIDMVSGGGSKPARDALITRVRVFGDDMTFLKGFNAASEVAPKWASASDSVVRDEDNLLIFWTPIRDTDSGEVLGHLELEFSKQTLLDDIRAKSLDALLIGLVGFAVVVVIGVLTLSFIGWQIRKLAQASVRVEAGEVEVEVDVHSQDELGQLANSFRKMVAAQRAKAETAEAISRGELDLEVPVAGESDVLGAAMQVMVERLTALQYELARTIDAQKQGDLDARCSTEGFEGAYEGILGGVNEALDSVAQPLLLVSEHLQEYAAGKLENELQALPGRQKVLSDSLSTVRQNLQALVEEGSKLAEAAQRGELNARGDAERFQGGYRIIIEGMNSLLEHVAEPLGEVDRILQEIAQGNLDVQLSGDFRGDFKKIENSVLSTLKSLNEILGHVQQTVDQVARGALQVSSASEELSEQATTQASSLEEISSSISDIGGQASSNAEHTKQTETLVAQTRSAAEEGNKQMNEMLVSMEKISNSSNQITQIIKTIEDIAFQTNLLALNAAVEAARAGVHGKGFAVVAEEVRNLAQRSAKASKETAELIEGSNTIVGQGADLASTTASSLEKILSGVTEVSNLIGQVARASHDQAGAVSQVNETLEQVDQITQSNASSAEQSASAAEELRATASQLQEMVARFRLAETTQRLSGAEQPKKLQETGTKKGFGNGAVKKLNPGEPIEDLDADVLGFDD